MRFSLGVLAFFVCGVWAQTAEEQAAQAALAQLQQQLPSCAVACLADLVPASGCDITDTQCICTNQQLATSSEVCLGANCTVPEALQTKNFQDQMCGVPERSRQAEVVRVCWALWTLAFILIAARFAARSRAMDGAGFGWDDWLALATLVIVTAITIIGYIMMTVGLGKDIWTLEPSSISSVLRYFWLEEILYSFAVCLTKLSIVVLYLRIFPDTVSRTFRNICFVVIAILVAQLIAYSISAAFQCTPVSYFWNQWDGLHEGYCINSMAQIYAGSATNITMDLVVFVLPIPRLLKVQISTRRKVGICATFLVGLFVTLCSIIRLYYVIHWSATTNPTWTYTPIAMWSLIEVDVGVICACMPALSGPFKKLWARTIGKRLSELYASRSRKRTEGMSGTDHSKTIGGGGGGNSSSAWRSINKSGGSSKVGKDSIMCNVSLNVSDEMELVDKSPGCAESGAGAEEPHTSSPPGHYIHDYRQKW